MLLWGLPSSGKTHLLIATVALAEGDGRPSLYVSHPDELQADATDAPPALVAIDRVDDAGDDAAGRIFTLFNALKASGSRMIAAARAPLAALPLREDVRSRLGWGLVYEVMGLSDDEKSAALAAYASERGFSLQADVIDYLLRHGRRDMRSLLATLDALDRRSLATKRPITVPMIKDWMQQEIEWDRRRGA